MSKQTSAENITLFAESQRFLRQLTADIEGATSSIYIQCMSFEADRIGRELIKLLSGKPAVERILLIDNYSRYVVNDTFVYSPLGLMNKNSALSERRALDPLLQQAKEAGIRVQFTSPMGFLLSRYPKRNHKKMVLVDQKISYVGGMNFTEHNFAWHDLMVRHTEPALGRALEKSFMGDLQGHSEEAVFAVDKFTKLYILNGYQTVGYYTELLELIQSANKIVAVSPYISYPFLDAIAGVPDNRVLVPAPNNKSYAGYVQQLNRYDRINYRYIPDRMIHMKFLLIDDNIAIYGSSNFDTVSYFFEKEILIKKEDPFLVEKLDELAVKLMNNGMT
ncbi:MAG: phosphatidylserine/phosphatidylglycerophosphate/cardiolipin synthase family protein [Balneolaceae bacterium]|nr:phosphatidylserine/phosphatidylglycerophosphate/cardiolipin synthase family protein [Balneolaceae bacterium]